MHVKNDIWEEPMAYARNGRRSRMEGRPRIEIAIASEDRTLIPSEDVVAVRGW